MLFFLSLFVFPGADDVTGGRSDSFKKRLFSKTGETKRANCDVSSLVTGFVVCVCLAAGWQSRLSPCGFSFGSLSLCSLVIKGLKGYGRG